MLSRPTSMSMSGSSGAFGIAGPQRRAGGSAAPRGCRASGCRYGCGDRRRADSRARPSARGRRCPADRRAQTSCRRSSPNTEPSIRSTWTLRPDAVSNALIWRTMKRRPGSVLSQSRKAPSSSDDRRAGRCRPLATIGRMAAADDDAARPSEGLPDRDVDGDQRFALRAGRSASRRRPGPGRNWCRPGRRRRRRSASSEKSDIALS